MAQEPIDTTDGVAFVLVKHDEWCPQRSYAGACVCAPIIETVDAATFLATQRRDARRMARAAEQEAREARRREARLEQMRRGRT